MKQNLLKKLAVLCLLPCGLYAEAQRGGMATKISKLVDDVQQAAPRATLTDDQKSKLQAGRQADRQKVMSLMTDIHTIVDNGMFSKEDQTDLATEFDSLKNH